MNPDPLRGATPPVPPAVLAAYPPAVRDCRWAPLPPGGGLSGGQVWRGELHGEPLFALKRWPASHTPERMRLVHERIGVTTELQFTPRLLPTLARTTSVVHDGRCWDVTTWLDGTPDLLARTSRSQLRAAGAALAHLHHLWLPGNIQLAPCSAVARRLALLNEWAGTRFRFEGPVDVAEELERSLALVRDRLQATRTELRRCEPIRGRVVAIHGDFWPENVLFRQEMLTGVLDFGNVGVDHPEVDLGRLLADVPGVERTDVDAAVSGYNSNAPFELSVPLVQLLAASGRLGSLANWHLRLSTGSPDTHLLPAALPRVRRLVSLVEAGTGH